MTHEICTIYNIIISLITFKTKYTFSEPIDDNRYKPLAISKLGYVDSFIQRIYIPILCLHYLKRKKICLFLLQPLFLDCN